MRRSFSGFTSAVTASLFAVFMLSACIEGPEGPAGPQGPQGEQGATGADGQDGQDANSGCVNCHDSDTRIKSRQLQWEASQHALGGNFERGNSASCAACHAHEGFIDRIDAGTQTASAGVANPTPPNCRTCHQIHTTYTAADFAFTEGTTDPFNLWITDEEVDFGTGTLCAQCHQPRASYTLPVPGGGNYDVTSSRFGPHHAPQGATLAGTAMVEFTGTETINGGPYVHGNTSANADGCVTCHMADPYGDQAGGHTMWLTYEYHGSETPLTGGCEEDGCHDGVISDASTWTDFDYKNVQTDVENLILALQDKLIAAGIVSAADDGFTSIHDVSGATTGTYTAEVAGAYWNYITTLEDRSRGVHNPPYIMAVLQNSIDILP